MSEAGTMSFMKTWARAHLWWRLKLIVFYLGLLTGGTQ